jgi:phosphoglycolate phosphatase-like HAD superfamily hydrolase
MKPGRRLIFVGDTVDDARSANAAGLPFIGIAAATHSRRDDLLKLFADEKAAAVIENVNEIEGVL